MSIEAIKDKYERPILSLRITITNKCNENCLYCHHDGMDDSQEEMNADEIYRICEIAKNIGVRKIRISGGEPLIRKDIVEIVSKIASLDFDDISITSNGTLLGKYAKDLRMRHDHCGNGEHRRAAERTVYRHERLRAQGGHARGRRFEMRQLVRARRSRRHRQQTAVFALGDLG